ncbi:hypothetical protein [Vibrio sp. WXL210]|uniref:hypothetical protein n=1 Tax=Vibrio sp. WXL210 TaxID=3450709 RepID=UPI003EC5AA92
MPKVTFIDESNAHAFTQFTAVFECGCSYSNRSWTSEKQCIAYCPEHNQRQIAVHTFRSLGLQPTTAETYKASLKFNTAFVKNGLSQLKDFDVN